MVIDNVVSTLNWIQPVPIAAKKPCQAKNEDRITFLSSCPFYPKKVSEFFIVTEHLCRCVTRHLSDDTERGYLPHFSEFWETDIKSLFESSRFCAAFSHKENFINLLRVRQRLFAFLALIVVHSRVTDAGLICTPLQYACTSTKGLCFCTVISVPCIRSIWGIRCFSCFFEDVLLTLCV